MSPSSGLRVRQHRRRDVELPVEFVVAEEHRAQVRFSASSSAADHHAVRGTSVDVSPGGMGIITRQFIPRMCEGSVRVYDPSPLATKSDGTPIREVVFEHRVKVRRVQMIGPEPTYLIGLSFSDPETVDPDIGHRISMLVRHAKEDAPPPSEGPGDADA